MALFRVDVTTKFLDSMMFIFLNNLLNILMIFQYILFNDFGWMLLSKLNSCTQVSLLINSSSIHANPVIWVAHYL